MSRKFGRLAREDMDRIVGIQLQHLEKLLPVRHMTLTLDEKARTWLANEGYDPAYGALPLKRVILRHLQNPLATLILEGKVKDAGTITASADPKGSARLRQRHLCPAASC